ncbi:hypothetical protein [Caproicibacter sp. BJN0012]|uniref:hypothetical protein n=1 Tax=Caproicibacter sp. BJN0012 TaxID=3110227 RepID=UPI002E117495
MKIKANYMFVGLATIIIVGASVFLPQMLSNFMDNQIIGQSKFEELEKNETGYKRQISILEKLLLLKGNSDSVVRLEGAGGEKFSEETVIPACMKEIKQLQERNLPPSIVFDKDTQFYKPDVSLYQNRNNPSQSMTIWSVLYTSNQGSGILALDDDTGKILMFTFKAKDQMQIKESAHDIASAWGSYLGLTLQSEKESKYDAKIGGQDMTLDISALYQLDNSTVEYPIHMETSGCNFGPSNLIN